MVAVDGSQMGQEQKFSAASGPCQPPREIGVNLRLASDHQIKLAGSSEPVRALKAS
jgi:hypothetical protein